jgi:ERCC4-related helicase
MPKNFTFTNLKPELMKIAAQLFTYEMKDLKEDVNIGDFFECISYHIYGAASFGPKEQMEMETLKYNLEHSGRDYLNSFLTLVVQSGVKLGHLEKETEIKGLTDDRDYQKEGKEHYRDEWSKAKDELRHHKMPEGKLEDEIVSLRKQLDEEKLKNAKLSRYKDMVDKVVQSEKFMRENDTDS